MDISKIPNDTKIETQPLAPCPIPLGWTVRAYRIPEKRGVGIQAVREGGGEFTMSYWFAELKNVSPTIRTVNRAGDSDDTSAVQLAALWRKAVERMREWEGSTKTAPTA